MRRYRKWVMTLGLVAAAPNVGLAGPFDFFRPKADGTTDGAQNQQIAEQVAGKLRAARLRGADIEIEYQSGTLTLKGQVADAGTKALATQLASGVSGVQQVDNQMTTGGGVQQAAAESPYAANAGGNPFAPRGGIQPAGFEAPSGAPTGGIQQVAAAAQESGRPRASSAAKRPSNQATAEQVAAALQRAGLSGYDIEVRCDNGVCTLGGAVSSPQAREAALRAASTVPSVTSINGQQLRVAAGGPGIQPANFQPEGAGAAPAPGYPMPPGYGAPPAGYPAGMAGPPAGVVPPPPGWAQPGASAVAPVYDQPSLPQYAWPSYAAYPNYAAVTYPKQYSASAWPYIGPFYPYPQVPLGWREVTLEWDDGHWHLDFNDRTEKWWWFMNPKNW